MTREESALSRQQFAREPSEVQRAQKQQETDEVRSRHNRRQAEVFDRVADDFLKPLPADVVERQARIVAAADIRPGHAVLDAGTGTGALLPDILLAHPAKVVACDLSAEMLRHARHRFGGRVHFVRADIVDLPAGLGPFDLVICNAMFGNIHDQVEALAAIRRLLKPGGRLVISHPMGRDFVRYLAEHHPETVPHGLPDAEQLAAMATRSGYQVVRLLDEPNLYIAVIQRDG